MKDTKERKVSFMSSNGAPIRSEKVGRNDPCPCGSGKKAKNCCGAETRYYVREGRT